VKGAESPVRTLIASGVEVCFANPGTSEINFVAALDKVSGLRAILCLFEGVVTGAAYGLRSNGPKSRLYSIALAREHAEGSLSIPAIALATRWQ
jgi:acetolactate synthase I/II/III large subunit